MNIEFVSFRYIKKELEKSLKIFDYRLNEIYVEYLRSYHSKSNFTDNSFIIKNKDSVLYCPLTIEKKDKANILNFFGDPFFVICKRETKELSDLFYLKLNEICSEMKIKKINLVLQKEDTTDHYNLISEKKSVNKICCRRYIDLSLDLEKIYTNFSRGLKNKMNKDYTSLKYKLIDYKNFNDNESEIIDMMKLHQEISKKTTRSKNTWLLNGEMIKNNNGLIVKTMFNQKVISYFFVIYTKSEAYYFTSCTYREYFNKFNNITHKSIYYVINYLKKIGCKTLTLGDCKTIYSSNFVTEKEKNIERFKNSFGGNKYINYYFNSLDQSIIDII